MSDLFERLWSLAFTYLLGYSVLGFGWACYQERPPIEPIAARIVLFGACLLALLFAFGVLAGAA